VFEDVYAEFERLRRRILREFDRLLAEVSSYRADWSPDGRLQPLYTVYEYPDRYVVLVDLPAADTSTITVTATRTALSIEAKLERDINLEDIYGTVVGREVKVDHYKHTIPLPEDADPEGIRVNVKPSKIIEIVIPRRAGRS